MDPISFELYIILCKYKIDTRYIFLWTYTLVQWSCMASSISIDDLTFGQIALGKYSLVIEYCDSKYDKNVSTLHQKTAIVIHSII